VYTILEEDDTTVDILGNLDHGTSLHVSILVFGNPDDKKNCKFKDC